MSVADDNPPILALFAELGAFAALKLGTTPLERKLHDPIQIDEWWAFTLNCTMQELGDPPIPPMTFAIEWGGGWPAGFISPFQGMLLCSAHSKPGESEAELSAAIAKATEALTNGL